MNKEYIEKFSKNGSAVIDKESYQYQYSAIQGSDFMEVSTASQYSRPSFGSAYATTSTPNHYAQPTRSFDSFATLEDFNKAQRTLKEAKRNLSENALNQAVFEVRTNLNSSMIIPISSLTNFQSPVFNTNDFHQGLLEVADSITAPQHSVVGNLISVCTCTAMATYGRVDIQVNKTWTEQTPLMFTPIAPSGTRKTATMERLQKPFVDFEQIKKDEWKNFETDRNIHAKVLKLLDKEHVKQLSHEVKTNGVYAACALAKEQEKNRNELANRFAQVPCQLLIDSATPSGLRKILLEQGESIGCITAEGDFLESQLLKTNSDPAFFNKLYSQESYSVSSNHELCRLTSPSLSMLCFVQPSWIDKLFFNGKLVNLGVSARLLPFIHSLDRMNQSQSTAPLSNEASTSYHSKILRLLELYYTQDAKAERYKVTLEPLAVASIKNFENWLRKQINCDKEPQSAIPAISKLHGQAIRLAWCIHAWNYDAPHEHSITELEVHQAIDLCNALLPHIRFIYDPHGLQAYSDAIKIAKNLQGMDTPRGNVDLANGYIDSRTIQQRTNLKSESVKNALGVLEECNFIKVIDNGRQSNIVVLHPSFMNSKIF